MPEAEGGDLTTQSLEERCGRASGTSGGGAQVVEPDCVHTKLLRYVHHASEGVGQRKCLRTVS
jgi:hypothetical protein